MVGWGGLVEDFGVSLRKDGVGWVDWGKEGWLWLRGVPDSLKVLK